MGGRIPIRQRFRVALRTKPGRTAAYAGTVEVVALDETDAVNVAVWRLKKGQFPGLWRSDWRVERVEPVPQR
jgi:hypothetical protein